MAQTIEAFPTTTSPVIAPLVTDFAAPYIVYRVADDASTLEEVETMIHTMNRGLSQFHPTLAIVVTWVNLSLAKNSQAGNVCFVELLSLTVHT